METSFASPNGLDGSADMGDGGFTMTVTLEFQPFKTPEEVDVTRDLPLIAKIVRGVWLRGHRKLPKEDLMAEANLAAVSAKTRWEPEKGEWTTFMASAVRGALLSYVRDNSRTMSCAVGVYWRLRKAARLPEGTTVAEYRELLGRKTWTDAEVLASVAWAKSKDLSLNIPPPGRDTEDLPALIDSLPGDAESVEEADRQEEAGEKVRRILLELRKNHTLTRVEEAILRERLMPEEDPKTLLALGDQFGLTKERIRQIESRLLDRLRRAAQRAEEED